MGSVLSIGHRTPGHFHTSKTNFLLSPGCGQLNNSAPAQPHFSFREYVTCATCSFGYSFAKEYREFGNIPNHLCHLASRPCANSIHIFHTVAGEHRLLRKSSIWVTASRFFIFVIRILYNSSIIVLLCNLSWAIT